ncbi:MAG: phosphate acetyltransferase [Candidatus Woesearchaeota archaeon]
MIMGISEKILKEVKKHRKKIIFTDYEDERLYKAIKIILKNKILIPIIVGDSSIIKENLKKNKLKNIDYYDPEKDTRLESFRDEYYMLRKHKGITLEQAYEKIKDRVYFSMMLLRKGFADGVVSGLSSKTKPFIPAFEIIKTREGIERASGFFIMDLKNNPLIFADCAVNIQPTEEQLAEIAILSAESARMIGLEPRVAMLSFSTRGSAKHELVDKIKRATEIAKQKDPKLIIDGEIQFDAAFVPEVFKNKCPDSPLRGRANVFVFPDLNAGNIGYKLVERIAGVKAIGPIIQGLNKPVNDISRGANHNDLVNIAAFTAIQAANVTFQNK